MHGLEQIRRINMTDEEYEEYRAKRRKAVEEVEKQIAEFWAKFFNLNNKTNDVEE